MDFRHYDNNSFITKTRTLRSAYHIIITFSETAQLGKFYYYYSSNYSIKQPSWELSWIYFLTPALLEKKGNFLICRLQKWESLLSWRCQGVVQFEI